MNVDETAREKRKADPPVPIDSDDDLAIQGTAETPQNPPPAMSLDELVRFSITQNEKNFKKLDRDLTKVQKEGAETRRMAARAVTSVEETKTRVDAMEKRPNPT